MAKMIEFPVFRQGRDYEYVDAMPGSGKTEYFVERAASHVKKKGQCYLIYVAPTIDLLIEAQERLLARLSDEQKKKVQMIVASRTKALRESKAQYIVEPPANAMNYYLGLISDEEYRKHKLRPGQQFSLNLRYPAYYPSASSHVSVLMITHEAFVRIKPARSNKTNVKGNEDLPSPYQYGHAEVVFDEARQCISKEIDLSNLNVSTREIKCLAEVFRFTYEGDAKEEGHQYYRITGMLPKAGIEEVFGTPLKELSKPVQKLLKRVKECANGRNALTLKLPGRYSSEKRRWTPVLNGDTFSPFVIMRPNDLFAGYNRVTLLSAMFKDSQMWKILRYHSVGRNMFLNLLRTDYLDDPGFGRPQKRILKQIKVRHEAQLKLAYDRLRVIPLTKGENGLSLTYLNGSMMLPTELNDRLTKAAAGVNDRVSKAALVKALYEGTTVLGDKKLSEELRDYAVPPLWVAMREGMEALKEAGCDEALLFINSKKANRLWAPSGVNYVDLVRDAMKYDSGNDEHLTEQERKSKPSNEWIKRLKKMCHGKNKFFLAPPSTSVRGLNTYREHTGYVHLAALNQEPEFYEYCECLLSEYDPDLDLVIDNVLQTLYRTNIRDPESRKEVFMVVPSEYAINRLAFKIFRNETTRFVQMPGYTPRMSMLEYEGRRGPKTDEGKARIAAGAEKRRKYSPEVAKEIDKAKRALAVAQKAKAPNPATIKKWEDRIHTLLTAGKGD